MHVLIYDTNAARKETGYVLMSSIYRNWFSFSNTVWTLRIIELQLLIHSLESGHRNDNNARISSSPATNVDARKGHGSCFQQGIADGKDQPFYRNTFSACGSAYGIEIMKGYLSVEGNTTYTCNNSEDADEVI